MNKNTLVTLRGVGFSYDAVKIVDDVSFTISRGSIVGLIGANGSGKTTLLKLIIGLLEPQQGDIMREATIGYVPQKVSQAGFEFPLTAEEVVLQGRVASRGMLRSLKPFDIRIAHECLDAVGMARSGKRLVRELSGGQQQRVFIARALAGKPDLLILDEPTVGVDEATQEEFYDLLAKLRRRHNLTILIVSHDIDVVLREVDTVLVMDKKIMFAGTPEELHRQRKQFIRHHH
jgi:zinc transport system ATP-binding protein